MAQRDRARLRRTLARNLARQVRRGAPTPEQVETSRVETLQERIGRLHTQIVPGELSMAQRRVAGKIPAPEAVASLPAPEGFVLEGKADFPPPGRRGESVHRAIGSAVSRISFGRISDSSKRRTRISLESPNIPDTVRHETAHQVLALRGVPTREHEPIIAQATVPGTRSGVNFRHLLETATEAHRAPTEEQQRRLSRQRQKLGVAARQRSNR